MLRIQETALWQEIAYLGVHLHWPLEDLLDLPHRDRVRLVRLVAGIDAQRAGRSTR